MDLGVVRSVFDLEHEALFDSERDLELIIIPMRYALPFSSRIVDLTHIEPFSQCRCVIWIQMPAGEKKFGSN